MRRIYTLLLLLSLIFKVYPATDQEYSNLIQVFKSIRYNTIWPIPGASFDDIEETYVLMAKFGKNNPEVRLKKYEECIADLKVTHSPRFYLNMDLEEDLMLFRQYLTGGKIKNMIYLHQ